jgi:CRP-like cAMP-binding protein
VTETYWLAEGLVKLTRTSSQGEEKVIELVNPGRTFGEALIFSGAAYPVNAVAQSPSRVLGIGVDAFKNWIKGDAERCYRIMAGMSMRLHHLIADIDHLSLMKGSNRLIQYLLDHSDPNENGELEIELAAPKQVIASRIGVKPETLSRLLHKLADEKLLEQRGNSIVITNPELIQTVRLG